MEVLVAIAGCKAVETVDRPLQRHRIDFQQIGQGLDRRGLAKIALLAPGLRLARARHGSREHVVAQELAVEHGPTRHGRRRLVPLQHGLAIGHVGAAFVHVAHAALVDEDGVGRGRQPLGRRLDVIVLCARRQGRLIADHLLHLGDGGAAPHHLLDHLAGVARRDIGPFLGGSRLILVAHPLVARETARIDEHAQARAHAPGTAVLDGRHAFDHVVLDNQLAHGRIDPNVDTGLERSLQHPALQRGSARDQAPPSELGENRPQAHLHHQRLAAPGLLEGAKQHRFVERRSELEKARPKLVLPRTKLVDVEQVSHHRPAVGRAAGAVVVIVRPRVDPPELDPLIDEEVDHLGRLDQIGMAALARSPGRIVMVADDAVEIGGRLLVAVLHPVLLHEAVVGYPHDAAGARRGAADKVCLFKDQNGLARGAHHKPRAHGASAASHDHEVVHFIKAVHPASLPFCPGSFRTAAPASTPRTAAKKRRTFRQPERSRTDPIAPMLAYARQAIGGTPGRYQASQGRPDRGLFRRAAQRSSAAKKKQSCLFVFWGGDS